MAERSPLRVPALLLTLLSLALGLWAGLTLLGWPVADLATSLAGSHGVLMVNGVLASLIGLERAVALRRRVFYLVPMVGSLGAILVALGGPASLGFLLVSAGAAGLVAVFASLLGRDVSLHQAVAVVGAGCLLGGNLLGAHGLAVPSLVPWWGAFLVLVIGAERLELTRVRRLSRPDRGTFVAAVGLVVGGCLASLADPAAGFDAVGAGWLALGVWLLLNDLAWRNLRRPGGPRYSAAGLLVGYAWLSVGGLTVLLQGGTLYGLTYDAGLHAVFLGFVLSMIFAHAPIILPALLGRPWPFHPALYLPLGVLHASLAVRVAADLEGNGLGREWAGLFNAGAIVLFGLLLPAVAALPPARGKAPALLPSPDGPPDGVAGSGPGGAPTEAAPPAAPGVRTVPPPPGGHA